MLENVVKRSELVYTGEMRYTKVIYYFNFIDMLDALVGMVIITELLALANAVAL